MKSFLEMETVEEANTVDMGLYSFLDRMSAIRNKYIFKLRESKRIDN